MFFVWWHVCRSDIRGRFVLLPSSRRANAIVMLCVCTSSLLQQQKKVSGFEAVELFFLVLRVVISFFLFGFELSVSSVVLSLQPALFVCYDTYLSLIAHSASAT